jgi:putative addiction module component (TIGR02574 family)
MLTQIDIEDIKKLSIEGRLILIESIWQSIVDEKPNYEWTRKELRRLNRSLREICPTPELTPAQKRELTRRLRDLEEHPERSASWEEVEQRLQAHRKAIRASKNVRTQVKESKARKTGGDS